MPQVTLRERHASYASIITVLALIMALVYAQEGYSDWDAVVSFLSVLFSVSVLVRLTDLDWAEVGLAAFLFGVSLSILLISLLYLVPAQSHPWAIWMDEYLLTTSIGFGVVAILLSVIARMVNA